VTEPLRVLLTDQQLDELAVLVAAKLGTGPSREPEPGPDVLLTAEQVAERLGTTVRYVYARSRIFPFVVRLPGRSIRFSARGLERYLARRVGQT